MGLEIGFDFTSSGRTFHGQQIEHEFRNGIRCGHVGRHDFGGIERGYHLVPIPVLRAKHVGGSPQFKAVAEEMVDHVHASALAVLKDDDRDAGRRHPRDEALEVRQPVLRRTVIERMRAKDKVALHRRLSGHDRLPDRLRCRDGLLQLLQ